MSDNVTLGIVAGLAVAAIFFLFCRDALGLRLQLLQERFLVVIDLAVGKDDVAQEIRLLDVDRSIRKHVCLEGLEEERVELGADALGRLPKGHKEGHLLLVDVPVGEKRLLHEDGLGRVDRSICQEHVGQERFPVCH